MTAIQTELFELTADQRFDVWKDTRGGRQILRDLYAKAAPYARRWRRTGLQVSMKLLWELERDRIREVRTRAQRRGIRIPQDRGYTLNNDFTPLVARHIYAHRPDWDGMFELRERGHAGSGPRLAVVLPMRRAS